jgi:agmatine deiminase
VDDITRFVTPTTVVTVIEDDPRDRNYTPLLENYLRLQAMTDQDGAPLQIVTLPMPAPLWYEGQRVPASYANFYIGNEVVLLPAYDPPTTQAAEEVLAPIFPGRRIVPIDCHDLIWGLGAFHCLTQQWPALP